MLNFVNPLFAWLALAAAIPLIIHLLNRRRYNKISWAAMEFLLKALHKNRCRLQIENLILLLLRMAIVIILALVLARPYLKGAVIRAAPDTHFVIAIDNSYSMGYRSGMSTLFDHAKKISLGLMESLKPEKGDKLSLITISTSPEILISETSFQREEAKRKLANLALSDDATDISKTLALAREIINKSTSSSKILYLITDNQRMAWDKIKDNSMKAILQDLTKNCRIRLISVGRSGNNNNQISRIYTDARIISAKKPVVFYAEARNYSTQANEPPAVLKVHFSVQGQKYASTAINLPRNNSMPVPFTYVFNEPGRYWIKMELESDNLVVDDSRLYAVNVQPGINTLIINGKPSQEPAEDEILYLRYALMPLNNKEASADSISPYLIDTITPVQLMNMPELNLDKYNLVILANLEFIPEEKVKELETFTKHGGGVLIFLGDKVNRVSYNESLYKQGSGLLPYQLGEVRGDGAHNEVVRFGEIDFLHPALSFFSAIKERFNTLAIYQYYELIEPVTKAQESVVQEKPLVLARLNKSNNPGIIAEKPYGKGRVVLVATSADTEWNLMPVRPMYVMLVDQIAMYLATFSNKATSRNIIVGEPIELAVKQGVSGNYTLRLPKKDSISLSPSKITRDTQDDNQVQDTNLRIYYDNTKEAGLYTLTYATDTNYFAVNPDAHEGDLQAISQEEIKQLIPSIQIDYVTDSSNIDDLARIEIDELKADTSDSAHIWKYLTYILLISIGLEMLLAWSFGRLR